MKIYYGSDLHLEFENNLTNLKFPKGDLLLLAGDIFVAANMTVKHEANVVIDFFERASKNFKYVVVIAGNYEYYNGTFLDTVNDMRRILKVFPNITVLDNEYKVFGNIAVFGSTFWTDMRGQNPEVMWDCQRGMSDYNQISSAPLRLRDTINANVYARMRLNEFMTMCEVQELFPVVLTHMAPGWECVVPLHRLDNLSYAYANTGLDDLLMDLYPKHVWIHGHMHKRSKNVLGNSTVLCNARGYVGLETVDDFKFKKLTLPC